MLTRRALLTGGIAAGAAMAVAGLIYEFAPDRAPTGTGYRYTMLDEDDRAIIAAIAPVMLPVALANGSVSQVVTGVDTAIAGLPLDVRTQIRQLFGVLRFPLTRMFVAGIWHPWHAADSGEIARFLAAWRDSRIVQLRGAYDALHQLIMASWYANTDAWTAIGYAGPPAIG